MHAEPQFIRAPGGEELVVLTREDYDTLIARAAEAEEDDADAALFDERMADLKAGREDVLPPEVSAGLMKGDTLVKSLRKWRGITQGRLCNLTGLAQGYVSDIERGAKRGSSEALASIAAALDVPAEWLAAGEAT